MRNSGRAGAVRSAIISDTPEAGARAALLEELLKASPSEGLHRIAAPDVAKIEDAFFRYQMTMGLVTPESPEEQAQLDGDRAAFSRLYTAATGKDKVPALIDGQNRIKFIHQTSEVPCESIVTWLYEREVLELIEDVVDGAAAKAEALQKIKAAYETAHRHLREFGIPPAAREPSD
jgi:hypothetical protein